MATVLSYPIDLCFDLDDALTFDIVEDSGGAYPIDQCFDLDDALTFDIVEDSGGGYGKHITTTTTKNTWEVFSDMPTVTSSDHVCTVCMEGFQSSGKCGKQLPCGHVYHTPCISTWLSIHNSCPLCRQRLSAADE